MQSPNATPQCKTMSATPDAQLRDAPAKAAGLLGRIMPTEPDSPQAWVIVFAAFLSMFPLFAVAYSFGAFVKPMTAEFHSGRAAISAIFSITAFIYFLFGAAAGHMSDRIGPRPMMVVRALFMGAGLVLTSSINQLWLSYLSYSIGVGLGVACGYVPMVAAVSGWFSRR